MASTSSSQALMLPDHVAGIPGLASLRARLPLINILLLQAGVALVTLHNTAFQDEALYLYAGRQMMFAIRHHLPLGDPFPQYLSGDPYFYPLVAGMLDTLGGVDTARMLSLAAMLATTACAYWVAYRLYGRESALFAAALFAFQGSVLFLARLATYDAVCLFFVALAIVVALRTSDARTPWGALAVGPLLVLAVLDKYAALLWVPSVLGILAWETLRRRGWRAMLVRASAALLSLAGATVLALHVPDASFLIGLRGSTTSRVITQPAPRLGLVREVISLGGLGIALAIIGCLLAARRQRVTALLFLSAGLLAPAYHIYKAEPISLDKHMAYGAYFLAPLAGYAIARLAEASQVTPSIVSHSSYNSSSSNRAWSVGLGVCLIALMIGTQQASWQFHIWGNSTAMANALRALVRPAGGRYLAEDMEVARYSLQDVTSDWQWTGPFWFAYTNRQHQYFYGVPAYRAALAEGYFDVVELSYGVAAPLDYAIQSELKGGTTYQLVAKLPYKNDYGSGYYWIWRKTPPPSSAQTGQVGATARAAPPGRTPAPPG